MTLCGGNPQALMLPTECLHHYHVAPVEADVQAAMDAHRTHTVSSEATGHAATRVLSRARRWLRFGAWG